MKTTIKEGLGSGNSFESTGENTWKMLKASQQLARAPIFSIQITINTMTERRLPPLGGVTNSYLKRNPTSSSQGEELQAPPQLLQVANPS